MADFAQVQRHSIARRDTLGLSEADIAQNFRLLHLCLYWAERTQRALSRGDDTAAMVAALAHSMTIHAHRNCCKIMSAK